MTRPESRRPPDPELPAEAEAMISMMRLLTGVGFIAVGFVLILGLPRIAYALAASATVSISVAHTLCVWAANAAARRRRQTPRQGS